MSLRVMLFLGVLVLIFGSLVSWLAPMTTSQPRSLTSIGTTTVSHGRPSSPVSKISREEVDIPRR
jgi:HAMP domain-containing protein